MSSINLGLISSMFQSPYASQLGSQAPQANRPAVECGDFTCGAAYQNLAAADQLNQLLQQMMGQSSNPLDQIMPASATSEQQPTAAWSNFGVDQPQQNPKSGNECWSGNAFGWAQAALNQAGRPISELDSSNSLQAYRKLDKQGKLQFGNPPAGALVFSPKKNGRYRLGFANPDGSSFRTTVPKNRNQHGIGDRALPENVAWMMPPAKKGGKGPQKWDPRDIHMTQTRDSKFNKTAPSNSADCVPTSAAMGLKALGIKLKGNPEQQISKVRYAMAHGMRNDRDGYKNGKWSLEEHSSGHGLVEAECINGLKKLGVKHAHVAKGVDKLTHAVQNGHPVVLFGANGDKIWGDKPGYHSHCNSDHAVLLSGYNAKTGLYTINDPLNHHGPIKITRQELARFHQSGKSVEGVVMKP